MASWFANPLPRRSSRARLFHALPLALLLFSSLALPVAAEEDNDHDDDHDHDHDHDHDEHGHEEGSWEWGGLFHLEEDWYVWSAQKTSADNQTDYADATMKMALLPAADDSEATLHVLEEEANHAFEENCTEVDSSGVLPVQMDACVELHFDPNMWQTLFKLNATGVEHVAIFTQHAPSEFEATSHFLKDDHGDDVEAEHVISASSAVKSTGTTSTEENTWPRPWGTAIGAALIVNLMTLVGVLFLVPAIKASRNALPERFDAFTSALAAGAILATAVFLILFESTHYVATGWTDETDVNWRWGTMLLAGFLFPVVLDTITFALTGQVGRPSKDSSSSDKMETVKVDAIKLEADEQQMELSSRLRLIFSVLVGDSLHNLCDGFFIGAGFRYCGDSRGWSIAAASIIHEIAQELSDYALLTGK
ncbi:MAG: hypothetical protein SGPRY_004940, partial [Prymnesium sp.]